MGLDVYTEQESRVAEAFNAQATCCCVDCEACGRVYFVTSPGHGDYEEGELENLRERAEKEPDRVIEVPDFSYVTFLHIEGKQVVIGCECEPTKRVADWIEAYADELVTYLHLFWQDKAREAKALTDQASDRLEKLDDMRDATT